MYLANAQTEQELQMVQKVKWLLLSEDQENHALAYNLIRGGGIHKIFFHELLFRWADAATNNQDSILTILHTHLETDFLHWLVAQMQAGRLQFFKNNLDFEPELLNFQHPLWDKDYFAKLVFQLTGKGVWLCLHLPDCFVEAAKTAHVYTSLNLTDQRLKYLCKEISHFEDLSILYLQKNQLTTLPEAFKALQSLQMLVLSVNAFETVPEVIFQLPKLRSLDLCNNSLTSFDWQGNKKQPLEHLMLRYNQLTEVPKGIEQFEKLSTLDLRGNSGLNYTDQIKLSKMFPNCRIYI
jgi:hypothetical protein